MADWHARYLTTIRHLEDGRKRAGLTQVQTAKRIGASRRTFQRYVGGEQAPDGMLLFKWAEVVGVDLASNLTPSGDR